VVAVCNKSKLDAVGIVPKVDAAHTLDDLPDRLLGLLNFLAHGVSCVKYERDVDDTCHHCPLGDIDTLGQSLNIEDGPIDEGREIQNCDVLESVLLIVESQLELLRGI
jgi:hypothetical protein